MIGDELQTLVEFDERYEEITLEGCKKLCVDLPTHTCSAIAYDTQVLKLYMLVCYACVKILFIPHNFVLGISR